jgi:hypothetical protein
MKTARQGETGKRPYVRPALTVKGDIATITQGGKSWGSGDSIISSITDSDVVINIVDSVTQVS